MCLIATSQRDRGHAPPQVRTAWKVVWKNSRLPEFFGDRLPRNNGAIEGSPFPIPVYSPGSIWFLDPRLIQPHDIDGFSVGFHVFFRRAEAEEYRARRGNIEGCWMPDHAIEYYRQRFEPHLHWKDDALAVIEVAVRPEDWAASGTDGLTKRALGIYSQIRIVD